ncbi:biotin--[acetyl-CoA-carboxylase] ligase [Novosphingobium flavum]|uniref:biotin--[biotin carboxyl-carrier protein] ligase n=1 Tax=Novosphingobium flavum TaxID=1778672 RepID=A0A7X1KM90_9SPHN|nr:biotin--[acetyl-CoA-carboxylase] ligase [Novosphingobium flavum]
MIEFIAETGSTNADLAARIERGEQLAEGHWLVADRQTAGRGRQGRAWFDGSGNFMGSTWVAASLGDPPLPSLALVAGLALHAASSEWLDPVHIAFLKWPNDLMIGGAKLAGILLERAGGGVVVGIGVNLAVAPAIDARETAALADYGAEPERDHFAHTLAVAFGRELALWRSEGLAPLIARWLAAAHPPGTHLAVGEPGEIPIRGTFAGLDPQGALILDLADGTRQTIHAGEVRLA